MAAKVNDSLALPPPRGAFPGSRKRTCGPALYTFLKLSVPARSPREASGCGFL